MSEPRHQELGKFGQFVVTAIMVGGFLWLCNAAWHSDSFWFKLVMGLYVVMFACMGLFIAVMMGSQWLNERRNARRDKDKQP